MTYYNQLERSLFASVDTTMKGIGYSDVVILYSSQDALEPSKTYCVLSVLDIVQTGRVEEGSKYSEEQDEIVSYFSVPYKTNIQYMIIGASARQVAPTFKHHVTNNRKYLQEFVKNGLGSMEISNLRNSPQKRDSGFVEAFMFDVSYSFIHSSTEGMGLVEDVQMIGGGLESWTHDYYGWWYEDRDGD